MLFKICLGLLISATLVTCGDNKQFSTLQHNDSIETSQGSIGCLLKCRQLLAKTEKATLHDLSRNAKQELMAWLRQGRLNKLQLQLVETLLEILSDPASKTNSMIEGSLLQQVYKKGWNQHKVDAARLIMGHADNSEIQATSEIEMIRRNPFSENSLKIYTLLLENSHLKDGYKTYLATRAARAQNINDAEVKVAEVAIFTALKKQPKFSRLIAFEAVGRNRRDLKPRNAMLMRLVILEESNQNAITESRIFRALDLIGISNANFFCFFQHLRTSLQSDHGVLGTDAFIDHLQGKRPLECKTLLYTHDNEIEAYLQQQLHTLRNSYD